MARRCSTTLNGIRPIWKHRSAGPKYMPAVALSEESHIRKAVSDRGP